VVTGASSGLGAAYAASLAARGHPLLLVARREERLRALARRLAAAHGVEARWAVCDLATAEGRAACRAAVDGAGPQYPPEIVVANAGFGTRGAFAELDREREVDEVQLNCVAVLDLARHTLPALLARGRGALVVVSSAAAFQPVPYTATYAATKVFELHLAEALAEEVRGSGVRVIAVCPGPTDTEFATGAVKGAIRIPLDRPEVVVEATWRALAAGRSRVRTGWIARLSGPAARLAPRRLVVRAAGIAHRPR
jgi:short-subunit dehydrogenase